MMNPRRFGAVCALASLLLSAQTPTTPVLGTNRGTDPPKAAPGFSIENMDLRANPCIDFYQYACGLWTANNPIPADQSRWDRFDALAERNREMLRNILEKSAVNDQQR